MKKKYIVIIGVFVCLCIGIQNSHLFAQNEKETVQKPFEVGATLPEDTVFMRTTIDGEVVVRDTKEINKETSWLVANGDMKMRLRSLGGQRAIANGVVNFRTKSATQNTAYTDTSTGKKGYTNGTYQADGAFLGYENGKVKFLMSGVIGLVESSDVQVLEYDDVAAVNYYSAKQGRFYHNVALNVNSASSYSVNLIGKQPSYIQNGSAYYSYDGHYFYTTYAKMMSDYKAGTRKNAVNATDPYYNYYQFVSVRSKTSFTANDMNSYLKSYLGNNKYAQSKLNNMGQAIIDAQNKYGANGLMTLGVAINESAFGLSNLALTKNNLFGLNAVDSNPNLATGFAKPQDSIHEFAKYYVHLWYSTPGRSTYNGGFLGNKASGMNVSYASDPNWGESAAAWMWYAENFINKTDVGKNRIGFKGTDAVNIRKQATTASPSIYITPKNNNMSFLILGEETGQSVNGSTKWYKIQLDPSLNASRTGIDVSGNGYDFSNSYGYVHSSLLPKTAFGNTGGGDTPTVPKPPTNPNPPSEGGMKKGDVNGDGKITSMDYVLVKNHILNIKKLIGNSGKAADVNGDGSITSMDYVLIKNHILGISSIN